MKLNDESEMATAIDRGSLNLLDEQACCAHTKVVLMHDKYPGGGRPDYWICGSGCGLRFHPSDVDQRRQRLLDEFAMASLSGWLASFGSDALFPSDTPTGKPAVAEECYKLAEALLTEREKRKANPCTKAS
jgi:hypothetical protein